MLKPWLVIAAIGIAVFVQACSQQRPEAAPKAERPFKRIGSTFSIQYTKWLSGEWGGPGVSPKWEDSLRQILDLRVDVIRLTAQWKDVEAEPGRSELARGLTLCGERKVPVILCVGIKVPRWPEVHIPDRLKQQALKPEAGIDPGELNTSATGIGKPFRSFLEALLKQYGNDPRAESIQIENEPLEAFGDPARSVPFSFLKEEVTLARQLTKKPLTVTMGAGLTGKLLLDPKRPQKTLKQLLTLPVQRVGLNLYGEVVESGFGIVYEAGDKEWQTVGQFVSQIRKAKMIPFAAEVQAEPWGDPAKFNYRDSAGNPFTPADYRKVLKRTEQLGLEEILLWGLEFQVACEQQGNKAWLQVTRSIIAR